MKAKINPSKTKEELLARVIEEGRAIPKQYIHIYYQSIPGSVESVLRQRGYPTTCCIYEPTERGIKYHIFISIKLINSPRLDESLQWLVY